MVPGAPVPRVLVVGSANIDLVAAVERLPAPGETVSEGTLLVTHGGKGANQAVAARRLGAEVRLLGCVGADASGAEIRAGLEAEGVGIAGLATAPDAATGTALIVVDARGQNQIAVAPGANRRLPPSAVERWETDFAWADVVLCQLETPVETVVRALELARARGKLTILNPAPVRDLDRSVWPLVDYLTPNESEAARLGGVSVAGPEEAAVIVTLGARGALASGPAGDLVVPAFPVTAVDTTAAGDAFNGALAVGLAEGAALWPALRLATAAAALACTKRGARPSLPGRAEVDALLDRAGPVDR
ncbi:MAG: ribokinase [Candidatus Rokuibacteriota bacterium]|nr:MAG: ribokinase [Candidatus Rokubacteria bacterium]